VQFFTEEIEEALADLGAGYHGAGQVNVWKKGRESSVQD
jgi:hypothetical protein